MAVRTLSVAGGNYSVAATWVELAVPTSADDVIFTATSGNLTVDVASVAKTFICTNWVGTLAMNNTLTVSGNVTLVAAMTIAGTSNLIINTTATLTSNGKTISGGLQLAGNGMIFTLADNWTVVGLLTLSASGYTTTTTTNGFTINSGGLSVLGTTSVCDGTTNIVLNGTGTWSSTQITGGTLKNNLTINTAGTITVSGNVNYGTGTLTRTAGSVVTTGSTLTITTSCILNTNSITWNNIDVVTQVAATITLTSNINCVNLSHTLYNGINAGAITLTGFNIFISGNLTVSAANNFGGTTVLIMNGTGTFSGSDIVTSKIEINTVGTLTINGTVAIAGIFLHTAGIVVTTGSTVRVLGLNSCYINAPNITFNNIRFSGCTLLSNINVSGILSNENNSQIEGVFNIYVSGSMFINGGFLYTSTTSIIMNGTGIWSGDGTLYLNLTINTVGTLTINGTVNYAAGILTYIAGTVVTTGSTLNIINSCTLNATGINWNNVIINTGTITLNSLLNVLATLLINGTSTFNGTAGFTCNTFSCTTLGVTINFLVGKTYTVTNSLIVTGTYANKISFVSTSTRAFFNLQVGATQSVQNCNATSIDSSGGQTIRDNGGNLISTINWLGNVGFLNFFMS